MCALLGGLLALFESGVQFSLHEPVLGAYDPNDKRSDHDRISPAQLAAGEPVTYTVRFQNTGTYPADFVRITDTLDTEHLDVATFRLLASSHPCQTTLSGAGKSARIVVTMGMPALVYRWFFLAHSLKSLERNILAFCGIRPTRATLIGQVEGMNEHQRAGWLDELRGLGDRGK